MLENLSLKKIFRLAFAFFVAGLAAGTLLMFSVPIPASAEKEINYKIEKIQTAPTQEAEVNYAIPIEVSVLAASDDLNWFKVRVSFDFLGHHEISGWTYIPLGNYIRENQSSSPTAEAK